MTASTSRPGVHFSDAPAATRARRRRGGTITELAPRAELARVSVGVGVVRSWDVAEVEDGARQFNAASLAKQVIGHLALSLLDDLDEPVHEAITVRHILSHTSGLPNWRPEGQPLRALRPPGQRWGYSSEGFVLLQRFLAERLGAPIDELADRHVFRPLAMTESRLDEPELGFHGNRPLITTARDYARFLAHVLRIDDDRWRPQWRIDDELAWGAGWGLELGPPIYGWQWGQNIDASGFVIGRPSTGDGVVVLTDLADGRPIYRQVVERELPGDHPSLRVEHNAAWIALFA
jgi:CubicO group peptidase (beta-lactamase class C family)